MSLVLTLLFYNYIVACASLSATPAAVNSTSNKTRQCTETSPDSCPPGLFCKEGRCVCGTEYPHNLIKCNGTRAFVLRQVCVSYDEVRNLTILGFCPYQWNATEAVNTLYYDLPMDVHQLHDLTCRSLNRTGALCGQCLPHHYLSAYSFSETICIPCRNIGWNWFRYIMAAYLPPTLLYIIILFFKINITSSHLFAVIYYCQTISYIASVDIFYLLGKVSPLLEVTGKVIISLYSIWNLDFFRPFYSDLCLGIGILPTLALDYAIAVYPLLLVVISYILIVLHDRNYRVVTLVWKPFRFLFSLFRRNWNIRTSVIDAYGTFFLLSNSRFLFASFSFLSPTYIYHLYPDHYNYTIALYIAGDVEYFGREHLPYAILAIFMLCVFVLLPIVILALYPFKFFRKFLRVFPVHWHFLHTFMDLFLGCYKDGTQPGTRDYRWFASTFFVSRLCLLLMECINDISSFDTLSTISMHVIHLSLLAALQPFKSNYNTVNIIFLCLPCLLLITFNGLSFAPFTSPHMISFFLVILAVVPILYTIVLTLRWMYIHSQFGLNIFRRLRSWRLGYDQLLDRTERLPDRIENSGEYHRENLSSFVSSKSINKH